MSLHWQLDGHYRLEGNTTSPLEFMPGLYVCRALIDDHSVYAGVCWSKRKSDNQRTSDSGFVNILEDDKVVSNPGAIETTT